MAWLTRTQIFKFVSLAVLIGGYLLAHGDRLPPVLHPYQGWIELGTGVLTVVQAWLIQPPRQEWTEEQRAAKLADEETK